MVETIRLYEALQCGCIPIVFRRKHWNYFKGFYGNSPLLFVTDWRQAPKLMRELLSDPVKLEAHAAECRSWWRRQKHVMAERYEKFFNEFLTAPKVKIDRMHSRSALTRTVTLALNSDRPLRKLASRTWHEIKVSKLRNPPQGAREG